MHKREMLRLLDRPGGRWALQAFTNALARRQLRPKAASVFWDGQMWLHRYDRDFFPDCTYYNYSINSASAWPTQKCKCEQTSEYFWFLLYRPKPGDVIVDIGAGRGEDAFAFSSAVGPTGRVLAVEAHPETFLYLRKTCEYNRFDNVRALNLAVSDAPGEVFIGTQDNWLANAITSIDSAGSYKVSAETLDNLFDREGFAQVDFLKMNIEGAETAALRGLERWRSRVRSACIACHDFLADSGGGDQLRTRAGVAAALKDMGFNLAFRDEAAEPWVRNHVYGVRIDLV
ncbi:MAG: FkbM family methyltransferase [Acidobacteriia bacterium]|nr:FkbM family methyltransferase [Terriglobia bacterium]